jgi:hypothetical protein
LPGAGGVRNKPLIFNSSLKCYTTYVLRHTVFEVSDDKFSNECTPTEVVEGRSYENRMCFVIGDMDPNHRQGISRGPSANVASIAKRYPSTAVVPQLQL